MLSTERSSAQNMLFDIGLSLEQLKIHSTFLRYAFPVAIVIANFLLLSPLYAGFGTNYEKMTWLPASCDVKPLFSTFTGLLETVWILYPNLLFLFFYINGFESVNWKREGWVPRAILLRGLAIHWLFSSTIWFTGFTFQLFKSFLMCTKSVEDTRSSLVFVALMILFHVPMFLLAVVSGSHPYTSKCWDAVPLGRYKYVSLFGQKFVLLVAANPKLEAIVSHRHILAVLCLVLLVKKTYLLPFYNNRMNSTLGGFYFSALVWYFCELNLDFISTTLGIGPIGAKLLIVLWTIIGYAIGYAIPAYSLRYRMNYVEKHVRINSDGVAPFPFWWAHDLDLHLRWAYFRDAPLTPQQLELAEAMYRYALNEAPKNVLVKTMYNCFSLIHRPDQISGRKLREGGYMGIFGMDTEYREYQSERKRAKLFEGHLAEGALSFRSDLNACRANHTVAANQLLRLYQSILNGKNDEIFMSGIVRMLETSVESATQAYENLIERFPSSNEVIKFYYKFCTSVKNDLVTGEQLMTLRRRRRKANANASETASQASSSGVSDNELSETETRSQGTSSITSQDTLVKRATNRSGVRNYAIAKHNLERTASQTRFNLLVYNFVKAAIVIGLFLFVISSSLGGSYHNSSEVFNFVHESGRRLKLSQSIVYDTRMFVLAGRKGNVRAMRRFQENIQRDCLSLHSVHRDLYQGSLVNFNKDIRAFVHTPQFTVQEYVMGTPPLVRNVTLSLWDLGNEFIRRSMEVATLTDEELKTVDDNSAFRFVIDNGAGPVFDAFEASLTLLQAHDISMDHFRSQMYFVAFAVSLWLLVRFVFQPSLNNVSDRKADIYKLLFGLPKIVIAQIFKDLKLHIKFLKRHELISRGFDNSRNGENENEDGQNDFQPPPIKVTAVQQADDNDSQENDESHAIESDSDDDIANNIAVSQKQFGAKRATEFEADALSATVRCLFIVLLLVTVMYAHSYYVFMRSGSDVAATITFGSQRSSYAMRLKMLAVELASAEMENLPGSIMRAAALRSMLQNYSQVLNQVHHRLKFGGSTDGSEHSKGNGLSSGMNELMYNIGGSSPSGGNSTLDISTSRDPNFGYYGIEFLLSRYLDECFLLLKDPTEALSTGNSHLRAIKDLEEHGLGAKLDEAAAMYATEAKVVMKNALDVQRIVFWILGVVIASMFMLVLRPKYLAVYNDFHTTLVTLIHLPMSVWNKVPSLQAFVDSGQTRQNKKMNIDKLEKKLQSIMESVPDAVVMSDERGVITSCNSAVLNIFGYEPYDVIGKNVNILMPEPYAKEHAGYIRRYLVTSSKRLIGQFRQLVGLDRHGRVFPIHLTIGESFVDKTRVFIATIKDISDIKIKEEKVHQTEIYLQSMLESAMNSIISCNEAGDITLFNEKAEQTFGYKKAEVLGMNVKMLMPSPYDKHHDEFIANYVKTGERKLLGIIRELTAKHRDGSVFPIEVALSEGITGDTRIFTAIIQDISKKKELEEAKLQAMESDTKTRVARQFLANMSHEIRTPLNGVIGMVELLLNSDLHGLQKQYATVVSNCSKALLALINDVLDVSKIEEGMMELVPEPFDLLETVETAVDVMSVVLMEKSMEGIVLIDPSLPLNVEGDANRIGQILRNLCGNAVKFTNSGHVMVKCRHKTDHKLNVSDDDVVIEFHVIDTGIGIHPNDQKKLFERFSQVDLSHKRQFEGSGLGLSISKELVELMDGRVHVESVVNAGSTFSFYVRLKRVDYIPAIEQLGMKDICANHSVLVVHEHKNVRDEIVKTLVEVVGKVRSCGLQRQCISVLSQSHNTEHAVTCILMFVSETDPAALIGLPETVNSDRRFSDVPIIAFVPFGKRDKIRLDKQYLRAIIDKPITQSKIWEALRMASQDNLGYIETATSRTKSMDSEYENGNYNEPQYQEESQQHYEEPTPVRQPQQQAATPQPQQTRTPNGNAHNAHNAHTPQAAPQQARQPPQTAPRLGHRESAQPAPRKAETPPPRPQNRGGGAQSAQPLPMHPHPMSAHGGLKGGATSDPCAVMLVEDNKVNQMMASAMIEQLGHNCTIANNGLEALDLLEQQDFDMILMDIQMPGMDGYATTEVIREKEQQTGKHAPILAFTAHTSPDEQRKALASGMDDVITKPVTATALNDIISKWRAKK